MIRNALLFSLLSVSTPHIGFAECCALTKVAAEAPELRVRACDPLASADCQTWVFEGVVPSGQPVSVCVGGADLVYQEWNAEAESWNPRTEARCADGGAVDL
jgi:hypothetical protein